MAGAYRLRTLKTPIKSTASGGIDLSGTKFEQNEINVLISELNSIANYYEDFRSVFEIFPVKFIFNKLLGKSRRFQRVVKDASSKQIDSFYKFDEKGELQDKIELTYGLKIDEIIALKEELLILKDFIAELPDQLIEKYNEINSNSSTEENKKQQRKDFFELQKVKETLDLIDSSKSAIQGILHDVAFLDYVERPDFNVPNFSGYATLYETISHDDIVEILKKIGITNFEERIINLSGEYFLDLDEHYLKAISELYLFIIRTASKNRIDFSDTSKTTDSTNQKLFSDLDFNSHPLRRETIGVIDSWANKELSKITNDIIEINNEKLSPHSISDYCHGTQVVTLACCSSMFQDNPLLKDKLGIFKVKHFGILGTKNSFMPFTLYLKKIQEIIEENHKEVRVWNLSIDIKQIDGVKNNRKLISELGRMFDRIQVEFDVIFIVSIGNSNLISPGSDSLMALSVGSCYLDNQNLIREASYSGSDLVFRRLKKPDVHDFGNDIVNEDNPLNTLNMIDDSLYIDESTDAEGTSFAAPLIARKCAYLLEKYDLSIQELRATINVLSKLSQDSGRLKGVDPFLIENTTSEYIFCWVKGEINPKDNFSEKITLPTVMKKKKIKKELKELEYKDFHLLTAVSHQIYPEQRWGDEYVGTEIEFKIIGRNESDSSLPALMKAKANNTDEKTEIQLIKRWDKYNPNSILIDKDFYVEDNGKNSDYKDAFPLKPGSLQMSIKCIDMFSSTKSYKYGVCFAIKGMNKDSLKNFEVENQDIIEKVYSSINTQIKEKIKA